MNCASLHAWVHELPVFRFPFDAGAMPADGIYLLFERGEEAHGGARIVRVGTHTGDGQLPSRLRQHFLTENKDRSIFRKNIGRALLARDADPFSADWELDLTSRAMRLAHADRIDAKKLQDTEERVSAYMRVAFSFSVIPVESADERLRLESGIISTVSLCKDCGASPVWLGHASPKEKIRQSGLWVVNELYKKPLTEADFTVLRNAVV